MPHKGFKANKIKGFGAISPDYCPPENITTFDGRIHITAHWLAVRFRIDPELMRNVIDDIEQDTTIYCDGVKLWIDDRAFIEIYQHPYTDQYFDETARMSVLQLLRHYGGHRPCAHLVQGGVAPLDCELTVCQCCGEQ